MDEIIKLLLQNIIALISMIIAILSILFKGSKINDLNKKVNNDIDHQLLSIWKEIEYLRKEVDELKKIVYSKLGPEL